jgi:hypothetical protein
MSHNDSRLDGSCLVLAVATSTQLAQAVGSESHVGDRDCSVSGQRRSVTGRDQVPGAGR